MKKNTFVLVVVCIALSACSSAPKSSEVGAMYIPSNRYSMMSCEQLAGEAESIRRSTPALEAVVDSHRDLQTNIEVVTWLLFWPAAFALDKGEQKSAPLAQARGELQAIQQALSAGECRNLNINKISHSKNKPAQNVEDRLALLKKLRDQSLINDNQYNEQVRVILSKE